MPNVYPLKLGGEYVPESSDFQNLKNPFNFSTNLTSSVAIIIPFRNREKQLLHFLNIMPKILIQQQVNFRIYVINQIDQFKFNRGALLNVGYLEAKKDKNYDCYIFHDVDRVILDASKISYHCEKLQPAQERTKNRRASLEASHLSPKSGIKHVMSGKIGGVAKMSENVMQATNGHSNYFYGWGGEDDDFAARIGANGYKIYHPENSQDAKNWQNCHGGFDSNHGDNLCHERKLLLNYKKERMEEQDGWRTTEYTSERILQPYNTRINVKLKMMEFKNLKFQQQLAELKSKLGK